MAQRSLYLIATFVCGCVTCRSTAAAATADAAAKLAAALSPPSYLTSLLPAAAHEADLEPPFAVDDVLFGVIQAIDGGYTRARVKILKDWKAQLDMFGQSEEMRFSVQRCLPTGELTHLDGVTPERVGPLRLSRVEAHLPSMPALQEARANAEAPAPSPPPPPAASQPGHAAPAPPTAVSQEQLEEQEAEEEEEEEEESKRPPDTVSVVPTGTVAAARRSRRGKKKAATDSDSGAEEAAAAAVRAPQTKKEEAAMIRRAVRDSTALQTALSAGRRVSERSQLQQALAASRILSQPPSIDPEKLAIIQVVMQQALAQDDLVEVEVPGNGDCLFICAIRAAESVGVQLRERLLQLEVDVPVGEEITPLHLRRGIAHWLRHNRELFGRFTADPQFKCRGLVDFTQPGDAGANSAAAAARTGQSWQTLKPVWLSFEETLEELQKPGVWTVRYCEPCDPTAADPDLLELPYLFDYMLSVLPFVLGASIRVFRKSVLLNQLEQSDLMQKLDQGSFVCDPRDILIREYEVNADARADELRLPPSLQLPLLTLIHQPEQNHWHYAVLKDADDASAAPSSAADSGSSGEAASAAAASAPLPSAAASAPLSSAAGSSATVSRSAVINVSLIKRIAFLSQVSCVRTQQILSRRRFLFA